MPYLPRKSGSCEPRKLPESQISASPWCLSPRRSPSCRRVTSGPRRPSLRCNGCNSTTTSSARSGEWRDHYLPKKIIDRHPPAWHGWFSFCNVPASIDRRVIRITGPVHPDDLLTEDVYVPDHKRPRLEIVGAFRSESILGRVAVVVLAPNFDRESGRALDEPSISSAFPSTR